MQFPDVNVIVGLMLYFEEQPLLNVTLGEVENKQPKKQKGK